MGKTVTLELPDDALRRYQQGAAAAHKPLEEFLADRLVEAVPPLSQDLPAPLQEELMALESLTDESLWQVAQQQLPPDRQDLYDRLLDKNSEGTITPQEEETLKALGENARLITLKKAHAYMLLKWRGHPVPLPNLFPNGSSGASTFGGARTLAQSWG